jgi:hypothetical protein
LLVNLVVHTVSIVDIKYTSFETDCSRIVACLAKVFDTRLWVPMDQRLPAAMDATPSPSPPPATPPAATGTHIYDPKEELDVKLAEVKRPARERKRRERKALLLAMTIGTDSSRVLCPGSGCERQIAPPRRSLGLQRQI